MPALTLNTEAGPVSAEVMCRDYEFGTSYPEGPWRTILYQVPWSLAAAFCDALVPSVQMIGFPPNQQLLYKLPHFYPGNTLLGCLEATATPLGIPQPDGGTTSSGKLFASTYAIVRAMYRKLPFDAFGTDTGNTFPGMNLPFTRVRRHTRVETELLPESALLPVGGATGEKANKRFPLQFPVTEITLTYHYFPYLYDPILEGLVNSLNSGTFAGFGKGQVKFTGLSSEPDTSSGDGTQVQTLEMTFECKPFDWNSVQSPTPGVGRTVLTSDGTTSGTPPYRYADLTPCLVQGTAS